MQIFFAGAICGTAMMQTKAGVFEVRRLLQAPVMLYS